MKIIIKDPEIGEEETVVFSLKSMTERTLKAIEMLKTPDDLTVYEENKAMLIPVAEVFYIESVDLKTFVYTEHDVYLSKSKLYEHEEQLINGSFLRISKQIIINLRKVKSVSPYAGGRFEAVLTNDEKIIISRQYVAALKVRFGL